MKRFLVLIFVFGVASAVYGAYVPTTVMIDAPASASLNSQFTVDVDITGGLASGRSITQLGDAKILVSGTSYTEGIITYPGMIPPISDFDDVDLAYSPGTTSWLFSFQVTATSNGTISFDLGDATVGAFVLLLDNNDQSYMSYGTDFGPITVVGDSTVIPEPMMIALLGLGGLLLRRRR